MFKTLCRPLTSISPAYRTIMTISQGSSAPVFVVAGITGNQGGSVLDAIKASSKEYKVRGLTRDAASKKAAPLKDQGVELVSVNLTADNKPAIVDALKGADIAFFVTNYWEHLDQDREINEGKAMIDAAKEAGVKTVVFSGLPSYAASTPYDKVYHFEGKAKVVEYGRETLKSSTFLDVQPAMYYDNFQKGLTPRKQEDGSFVIFQPSGFKDADLSLIDINADYGKFVVGAIENGAANGSQTIAISETIKGSKVAEILSAKSGKAVNIYEVPEDDWKQAVLNEIKNELVVEDLKQMFSAHYKHGYFLKKDPEPSRKLASGKLTTFQEWVDQQDWSKIFA